MDVHMPRLDGLEATRAIRAMPLPKGALPIVALTANAMHGDRERFLAAGMDDYLAKPVDRNRLAALLDLWSQRIAATSRQHEGATVGGTVEANQVRGLIPQAAPDFTAPDPVLRDLPVIDHEVERDLRDDLGNATYDRLAASLIVRIETALGQIREFLDRGDTESALQQAHLLSGEVGSLGFTRLGARLAAVEKACRVNEANARLEFVHAEAAMRELLALRAEQSTMVET